MREIMFAVGGHCKKTVMNIYKNTTNKLRWETNNTYTVTLTEKR